MLKEALQRTVQAGRWFEFPLGSGAVGGWGRLWILAFFLPISKCLQGLHCFHNKQCVAFKQVEGACSEVFVEGVKGCCWVGTGPLGAKASGDRDDIAPPGGGGQGRQPSLPHTWISTQPQDRELGRFPPHLWSPRPGGVAETI